MLTVRVERSIAVLAPFVAMAAVAVGLRWGAPDAVLAALVVGAPPAEAGTGLAWQVLAVQDQGAMRSPLAGTALELRAHALAADVLWTGSTNRDGVAEALLPLPSAEGLVLEVRTGGKLLASGAAVARPAAPREDRSAVWMPFARRTGAILLDVTVLGQSVAPGFVATLCAHATDAATGAPLSGVGVEAASDTSVTALRGGTTDSAGWATLRITPVGLAADLTLRARARGGQTGEWIGGLYVSPGGAGVTTRPRWGPDEEAEIELVVPTPRKTEYLEVDDAHGRAWAAALDLGRGSSDPLRVSVRLPRLRAGIYWAIATSDPAGATRLGPTATIRPFFVAASDDRALALGSDPVGCNPRRDDREFAAALWPCLALSAAAPVPRWTALDGVWTQRQADRAKRERGLAVAIGAMLIAALLEAALMLRAARRSQALALGTAAPLRASALAVGLLIGLLGFALLTAFLMQTG